MTTEYEDQEILLVSTEDIGAINFDSLQQITQKIVQINRWRRQSRSAFVYDDRYLEIKHYDVRHPTHYWLNLMFLNAQATHIRLFDWRWGIATLFLAANTCLVYALSQHTQYMQDFTYTASLIVLLGTAAVLSLFAFINFSKNEWHYTGRHSGITLCRLMHNKPSAQELKAFIAKLNDKIRQVQSTDDITPQQRLAAELGEHRRLYQEKILSAEVYEQAKQMILNSHD